LDLDGIVGGIELSLIMPRTPLHIQKINVNVLDTNAIGVAFCCIHEFLCQNNKKGCTLCGLLKSWSSSPWGSSLLHPSILVGCFCCCNFWSCCHARNGSYYCCNVRDLLLVIHDTHIVIATSVIIWRCDYIDLCLLQVLSLKNVRLHCFAFATNESGKFWHNYISMGLLQIRTTNSKDLGWR